MQYNASECRCNEDHWIEVRLSLPSFVFHPKLHGIIYYLCFTRISQGAPTPVGGRQPIILQKFRRKLHENERIWTQKAPLAPPWIRHCWPLALFKWNRHIRQVRKKYSNRQGNLDLLEIYSLFNARWTSGEFNQISLAFAIFAVCVIFNNCISMKTGSYLSVNRFLADLSALKLLKHRNNFLCLL